jgi:hypothetical protein
MRRTSKSAAAASPAAASAAGAEDAGAAGCATGQAGPGAGGGTAAAAVEIGMAPSIADGCAPAVAVLVLARLFADCGSRGWAGELAVAAAGAASVASCSEERGSKAASGKRETRHFDRCDGS